MGTRSLLLLGLLLFTISGAIGEVMISNTTIQYNITNNGGYTKFIWDTSVDSGEVCWLNNTWKCLVVNMTGFTSTGVTVGTDILTIADGDDTFNVTNYVFPFIQTFMLDTASTSFVLNNGTGFNPTTALISNVSSYSQGNNDIDVDADLTFADRGYLALWDDTDTAIIMATNNRDSGNWRADFTTGIYEIDLVNDSFGLTVLSNISLTQTGSTATDYEWDEWIWTIDAPTDPVNYWKFNEATGSIANDTGSAGDNGTILGTGGWVHGKQAWALDFDGTGDYINLGDVDHYNGRDEMTVSLWMNIDEATGTDQVVGKNGEFSMNFDNDDSLRFFMWSSGIAGVYSDIDVVDGDWHHIVVRYNGTKLAFFIDGSFEKDVSDTGNIDNTADVMIIGANSIGSDAINGVLDDLRFYDYAISESEITALYGNGVPDVISNSQTGAYGGYSTTNSFAYLFGNSSLTYDSVTNQTHNLGTGSNYTTWRSNYVLMANDFGVTVAGSNPLSYCDSLNNLYPNTNTIDMKGVDTLRINSGVSESLTSSTYEWNFTVFYNFEALSETNETNQDEPPAINLTSLANASLVGGKYGNAYDFANNAQQTTNTSTGANSDDFSVCMFLNLHQLKQQGIIHKGSELNANWDWRVFMDLTNQFYFGSDIDGYGWVKACDDPVIDTWYQVCYVYDDSETQIKSYCNGLSDNTNNGITVDNTVNHLWWFAGQSGTGQPLNGIMDEFYFFNRTLTATEVISLYNNQSDVSDYNDLSCTPTANAVISFEETTGSNATLQFDYLDEYDSEAINQESTVQINYTGGAYGLASGGNATSNTLYIYPWYATLDYDLISVYYWSDSYTGRYHYLLNSTLTNVSSELDLYNLDSSTGTATSIKVQDADSSAVAGVRVVARREFLDQAAFISVAEGVTGEDGFVNFNLEWNGPRYDFQIINHTTGTVIKTSKALTINGDITVDVTINDVYSYWDLTDRSAYSNTTTVSGDLVNFTSAVVDTSGLMSSVKLTCVKSTLGGIIPIYVNTSTGTSVSMTCVLGNTTDGVYMMNTEITFNDDYKQVYNEIYENTTPFIESKDGLFVTSFL